VDNHSFMLHQPVLDLTGLLDQSLP